MLEELFVDEEIFSWVKVIFVVGNVFLTALIFFKMSEYKKYEDHVEKHHQNPNKDKVCMVIAHPDDEAMFFVPTIKDLVSSGKTVSLICFSNGNYEGLGKEREKELKNSCDILGISSVKIINHKELQDGPNNKWSTHLIAEILGKHVKEEKYGTIITFDEFGISSHPNHIAIHYGVKQLLEQISIVDNSDIPLFQVYTLDSTNLFRKYIGYFDILISPWSAPLMYSCFTPLTSFKAMKAHYTQFVWFRRLFVIFSRYGYINTLHPLILSLSKE